MDGMGSEFYERVLARMPFEISLAILFRIICHREPTNRAYPICPAIAKSVSPESKPSDGLIWNWCWNRSMTRIM